MSAATAIGADEPVRARPGHLPSRTRSTATDRDLPRDQLLHGHHHRAAARARRRAARRRWAACVAHGLRGRPVDVLQAAARGPRALFGDRHPRDAALPAAARADRRADRRGRTIDRRARLLVPARHGGDELPARARQELGRSPRRSTSTASGCATSTARALRARRRGLPRRLPARPRVLRRRAAAVHRARPLRRRAAPGRRGAARRGARAAAAPPRPAPAREPVRALRRAARATTCRAARGRRRRLPRLRVRDRADGRRRRSSSPPSHVDWLLGEPGAPAAAAMRAIVDGCKVLSLPARPPPRVRPRAGDRALAAAWERAHRRRWTRSSHDASRRAPSARRSGRGCERSIDDGWEAALRARRARRTRGARRPRLAAGARARDGGRRAARRRALATGRRARPRRRGLVVSHRFEAEPAARGRGGRARASTASRPSPRSTSTASRVLESDSMFAAHAVEVGALLEPRQRAGDLLPGARAAAARSAASRARAGARGSSSTAACASSARCCSAARRASRPGPPPSAPGAGAAGAPAAASPLDGSSCGRGSTATTACWRCGRSLRALDGAGGRAASRSSCRGPSGTHRAALELDATAGRRRGERRARLPAVAPLVAAHPRRAALHDVRLLVESPAEPVGIDAGRVGFRDARAGAEPATTSSATGSTCTSTACRCSPAARVWTPLDAGGFAPARAELRAALETVRDGGHEHAARAGHRRL